MRGYLVGARNYRISELAQMDPEEIQFTYYWVREAERQQLQQFGRLLGTSFEAGEIRSWSQKGDGTPPRYRDHDSILLPLTIALRPEVREALMKLVGSAAGTAPEGYQKRAGEVIVNLADIPIEEFKNLLQHGIEPPSAKKIAAEMAQERS